jgi:hypothetical protein
LPPERAPFIQSRFGHCEEKNLFHLPGIKRRFPGLPARNLVATPTELSRLYRPCENICEGCLNETHSWHWSQVRPVAGDHMAVCITHSSRQPSTAKVGLVRAN